MTNNPLQTLQQLGQSVWLDYIDRTLLASGGLQRMVDAGEVTGVTSNPTIFQKAIATCDEYDATIRSLDAAGKDTLAIWEALSTADIAAAASILEPVHKRTGGRDGYVSIEVAPSLAHDAAGTMAEARHLFRSLGRRNVMIKVPATSEGVEALEELTAEGINVNATLIFSVDNYVQVASAYIRGLHRLEERKNVCCAVGRPQRQEPMVSICEHPPAADGDEAGVALFRQDHDCTPSVASAQIIAIIPAQIALY